MTYACENIRKKDKKCDGKLVNIEPKNLKYLPLKRKQLWIDAMNSAKIHTGL